MASTAQLIKALKLAISNDEDTAAELEVERLLEQFIERGFEKNMEKLVRELKQRGVNPLMR